MPLILIILLAALCVFVLVSVSANNYLTGRKIKTNAKTICQANNINHTVIIKNDKLTPAETEASRCDSLTIINNDNKLREIGFGEHDHHIAYDGVSQKNLDRGESFTISLNKTGTYHFHDHFQDEVEGNFTVN